MDGIKIFVNKNAIKLVFHHNCDFYFSGEFYGEFCLFFSEFWKIFSRSTDNKRELTLRFASGKEHVSIFSTSKFHPNSPQNGEYPAPHRSKMIQ